MTKEQEYQKVLEAKGLGDLAKTFSVESVKTSRTSSAQRKAEWKDVITNFDKIDQLIEFQDEMEEYVDRIKVVSNIDKNGVARLNENDAKSLMEEFTSSKMIKEFLEARTSMIREMVFAAIDTKLAEEGVEDPSNENGVIEVPELGKKFCREGAGFKDPSIDMKKLEELLGDDWKSVTVTKVIPEQRVEEFDEDLFANLVRQKPEILEKVREATVQGKRKSPRFQVRDMK